MQSIHVIVCLSLALKIFTADFFIKNQSRTRGNLRAEIFPADMGEVLHFHQPGILYLSYPTMLSQCASSSSNVWGLFLLKVVHKLLQSILIIRKKAGKASALTALISPVLGPHGVFGSTSTSHSKPLSSPSPIPESL